MSCSDIPGMKLEAVDFVQSNLMLNLSEMEARVQFTRLIHESLKSKFPRLNFFVHWLFQKSFNGTDESLLSFAARTTKYALFCFDYSHCIYSTTRIERVTLIDCEKCQTNGQKVYVCFVVRFCSFNITTLFQMYKLMVRRLGETVPTHIHRSYAEFYEFYVKLCVRYVQIAIES